MAERAPYWMIAMLCALTGCSALVDTDPSRLGDDEFVDAGAPPDGGTIDAGVREDSGGGGCAGGCDDGIACTVDTCAGNACASTPNDALCGAGERCNPASGCVPLRCAANADCDDGNACNGVEVCGGPSPDPMTGCSSGGALDCDDDVPCTSDRCDPTSGCVNSPVDAACDDGVSCTVDVCDAARGCVRTPNDDLCDDGLCFRGGRCDATRGCFGATEVDCRDGDLCTADFCEPGVGCQNPDRDDDGDGFALSAMGQCGGNDCDDDDENVYPGAPELCNGVDDDCDGDVDEDPMCEALVPDDCDSATPILLSANTGTVTGSFVGLSDDYDTLCQTSSSMRSAIGGSLRGDSRDAIHYVDIPSGTWDVRIWTEGSTVDTVLAVARTCGEFNLGGLGCNDDVNIGTPQTFSRIWLHRIGSSFSTTRVYLLVEPYGTTGSGDYTINVRLTSAADDACGRALDIRGGGTVIGFAGVAAGIGGQSGSCQSGIVLEGEQLFFFGFDASSERPAVFEMYSDDFTPDVYARTTCSNPSTERDCDRGENIGGGIQRSRITVTAGGTVFADGISGGGDVFSLFYDP